MSRRRLLQVACLTAVFWPVGTAQLLGLPKKVPPPPPGTIEGTRACDVGRQHDLARYRADLGCLRGNLALAALASTPLDRPWAESIGSVAREIGLFASTLEGQQPEVLFIEATRLDLVPTELPSTPKDVVEALCGFAKSTYEDGCIAYYCGNAQVRGSSPELNELGMKLARICQTPARCLPRELNMRHESCHRVWHEDRERLSAGIRAKQGVKSSAIYSQRSLAALQDWSQAELGFQEKLREAVFSGAYEGLPAPASNVAEKAATALLGVRQDELKAWEGQLATLQERATASSSQKCLPAQGATCALERERTALDLRHSQESLQIAKKRLSQAERTGDEHTKLQLLRPELDKPVLDKRELVAPTLDKRALDRQTFDKPALDQPRR
jgi:hypothetical protein